MQGNRGRTSSVQDMTGRTAVITGAASGIGAGMARAFADAGLNLGLVDVEEGALTRVCEGLDDAAVQVHAAVADVSDRDAMVAAATELSSALGDVHILCNNAGVGYAGKPLDTVPAQDWDWVVGVNLMGVINGLLAFLPLIQKHGGEGHVVNTASIGGHHVMPGWGHGVYSTTKYAVVGLSEALLDDLSDSPVGVSVLCPAAVDTAIYDGGRNRPARFGGPFERAKDHPLAGALKDGMAPVEIGRWVLRAIADDQFWIFTHPHTRDFIDRRHGRLHDAFAWADRVRPDIDTEGGEANP